MPRRIDRRPARPLTFDEWLELLIGPVGDGVSCFASDRARREAWTLHRAELLAAEDGRHRHCWAARHYDGAPPRPPARSADGR